MPGHGSECSFHLLRGDRALGYKLVGKPGTQLIGTS